MNNDSLIKLLNLVREVTVITDKNTRKNKIHHITAYGAYLYYTGVINNDDFNQVISYIKNDIEEDKLYVIERDNIINELLTNNMQLNNFFRNILNIYWQYNIKELNDNINIDIEKEFNDFMKYMNCSKLYNYLKNNNCISNKTNLKHSICLDDRDNSYIILKNQNSFHEYLDLSHEIAHAYENRVLSKYNRNFDAPYNIELLSITFNRIFIEYLYLLDKINDNEYNILLNNFDDNYYNFLRISLFISDSINSNCYKISDYDISIFRETDIINCSLSDYNYALGRVGSFYLYNEWLKNDTRFIKEIPSIIEDIYYMNIPSLIKYCNSDTRVIYNELSKCFKKR